MDLTRPRASSSTDNDTGMGASIDSPPSTCTGWSLLASSSTRPAGNCRLTATDSKPCFASSAFSAFSLMRGIGPPFFDARILLAHHIGPERAFSTVATPAVDANPAQHHLPSFAPQFMGVGFVGERRGGEHDFSGWLAGSRDLESAPSHHIFEEGFGGLILARRGRRPDGKRRASSLQALRLGRGIDDDGRNTKAILGHRKLQPR